MTSPDRIGFRRLQKWVRIWSINKDCEFLGIIVNFKGYYLALPISQVFIISCCDLFVTFLRVTKTIGWRRKVKTHVKLTNGNLEPLPSYVILCYSTTLQVFQKKVPYRKKWSQVKVPGRKKKERIGIRNANDKTKFCACLNFQSWYFALGTENVKVINVQTVFWVGFVSFGLIVVQKTSRLASKDVFRQNF